MAVTVFFLRYPPTRSATVVQVSTVHYCNTVPLQMQNALNTIKLQKSSVHTAQKKREKKSNLPQLQESQGAVTPSQPSPLYKYLHF